MYQVAQSGRRCSVISRDSGHFGITALGGAKEYVLLCEAKCKRNAGVLVGWEEHQHSPCRSSEAGRQRPAVV